MSAHNTNDLAGLRFGRLIALRQVGHRKFPSGGAHAVWECICECGTVTQQIGGSLVSGHTKSCGCLKRELKPRLTHGHASGPWGKRSKLYRLWISVRQRPCGCCERWQQFEHFLADMGEPQPGMTLDRIDNSKGYSPENCRWASRVQQARNRTITVCVEHEGQWLSVAEVAEMHGLKYATVLRRFHTGKRGADLVKPVTLTA